MELTVNINNIDVNNNQVVVIDDNPIITWNFEELTDVNVSGDSGVISSTTQIEQFNFTILIADNNVGWGKNYFVGNITQSDIVTTKRKYWRYLGPLLTRGQIYYGQVKVLDELSQSSGWVKFSFRYNSLPIIQTASLSPSFPTVDDDITLSYTYYDADGDTESGTLIHWYQNGEHLSQFDNNLTIRSDFTNDGDVWAVHVIPSDGYEYGQKYVPSSVIVNYNYPEISSATIIPSNSNENDILKAEFVTDFRDFTGSEQIRWFVNNVLQPTLDNNIYARPDVVPGDVVFYQIKYPEDTLYSTSQSVTIVNSNFIVRDIRVDGMADPLIIITTRPIVTWTVHSPANRNNTYVSIRVGTFYGANNVYSSVINTDDTAWRFPDDLLEKGNDYFVGISVSDSTTFSEPHIYTKFRVTGSRWTDNVENTTGWTVETSFVLLSEDSFDEQTYQFVRIQDGNYFGEIRIHNKKLAFVSSDTLYSAEIETQGAHVLTIIGKNNDVRIYLDRILLINADGLFTQPTSAKLLEIGNNKSSNFVVYYKYVYYTTLGDYYPESSSQYYNMSFGDYLNFPKNSIVSLKEYIENLIEYKIFSANPHEEEEGSTIYKLSPGESINLHTVNRTYSPINKIGLSPDKKYTVFSHSKGASIFRGYHIEDYTSSYIWNTSSAVLPNNDGWELYQNLGTNSVQLLNDGLIINTLYQGQEN